MVPAQSSCNTWTILGKTKVLIPQTLQIRVLRTVHTAVDECIQGYSPAVEFNESVLNSAHVY